MYYEHMNPKKEKIRFLFFLLAMVTIVFSAIFLVSKKVTAPAAQQVFDNANIPQALNQKIAASDQVPVAIAQNGKQTFDPIEGALKKITKKPFGIYITAKNSPVQPEKFQGFHTGADLEINLNELNSDVPVLALCDGKFLAARNVGGYGGVLVQSCLLDGSDVTVIYGHIRLSDVTLKIGQQIKAGDFLANLGDAYSAQTDGERKHLHLGIHLGNTINILGYVQDKAQLSGWIDPAKYL